MLSTEAPFEMANLSPRHTGLPFVVWISYRAGARHDIRVKVSLGPKALPEEMVSVAMRPNIRVVRGKMIASDFALLRKWIDLNRDVLVRYWEGDLYTEDAIEALESL